MLKKGLILILVLVSVIFSTTVVMAMDAENPYSPAHQPTISISGK